MKTLILLVPKSLIVQSLELLSKFWIHQHQKWRQKIGPPILFQERVNHQTLAEKNGLVLRDRRELGLK